MSYTVINRITKTVTTVDKETFSIITNRYHFKAAFLKSAYSQAYMFTATNNSIGTLDLELNADFEFGSIDGIIRKVTYQEVIDGHWILMPDTPAFKVLYT